MHNFQVHQENAYVRTARLIVLLGVGLVVTTLVTGFVAAYVVVVVPVLIDPSLEISGLFFLCLFAVTSAIAGLFIACASIVKLFQLRDGGAVIAKDLGGRELDRGNAGNLDERKILNIVEEIAIASGVPVPPVYLMDREEGINAFAAGYSPHDAVIGVTRGCITRLTRDQLQGVVAHEFSHILNGDMRMNLRVIGVLHGILAVTIFAQFLMEYGIELIEHPSDEGDGTVLGIFLIFAGALLWPVGLVGVFVGVLIKAAMSRQREYLADASAVEFTRNPEGIGGALKVIGGFASRVRNRNAVEASHLFFAEGYRGFARLFASHPPLVERIRRIDPNWDGVPIYEEEENIGEYNGAYGDTMNFVGGQTQSPDDAWQDQSAEPTDANGEAEAGDAAEESPWTFTNGHAEQVRATLSPQLIELAADRQGAGIVAYCLWLCDVGNPARAMEALDGDIQQATAALLPIIAESDAAQRLILLDTVLEVLPELPPADRRELKTNIEQLTGALTPTMFQWMWSTVLLQQLTTDSDDKPRYGKLTEVQRECEVLLSALVDAGGDEGVTAEYTFQRGAVHLELEDATFRSPSQCGPDSLTSAIDVLRQLAPRPRRQLLLACGACVTADQEVSEDEACLIRGICSALKYPIPAVLPGQPVMPGA